MHFSKLTLTALAALATTVAAHGYIENFIIDGKTYPGYSPYYDNPLASDGPIDSNDPGPERIAYSLQTNGPIYDVTAPNITCSYNPRSFPPALTAPVRAGGNITLQYTPWPTNHFGSILWYLARCPAEGCSSFWAPTEAEFFKVAQWGREGPEGEWVSERFIEADSTWTLEVPRDLKGGEYVARVELVSLHAVGFVEYGAELYPQCFHIEITDSSGTKTPKGVKFPGPYKMDDPGFTFNETLGDTEYIFPGPEPYSLQD